VFVRLGATYVLKAIGVPAIEGLRRALRDESPHVAYVASKAAAEIGSPAKVLVPELATNLDYDVDPTTYGHFNGAELTIKALGPDAAAATPKIVELYTSGRRPNMAASCMAMLTAIGPGAREFVGELVQSDKLDDKRKDDLRKLLDLLEKEAESAEPAAP